ncbi:MAG: hypothetical protein ACOC8G_00510 [Thermodesulfobacteriota bacterium]
MTAGRTEARTAGTGPKAAAAAAALPAASAAASASTGTATAAAGATTTAALAGSLSKDHHIPPVQAAYGPVKDWFFGLQSPQGHLKPLDE